MSTAPPVTSSLSTELAIIRKSGAIPQNQNNFNNHNNIPPSHPIDEIKTDDSSSHPLPSDDDPSSIPSSLPTSSTFTVPSSFNEKNFRLLQAKLRRMENAMKVTDERFENLKREKSEMEKMERDREREKEKYQEDLANGNHNNWSNANNTPSSPPLSSSSNTRPPSVSIAALLHLCEIPGCRRNADGIARCEYANCGLRLCYGHHTRVGEITQSDGGIYCPKHRPQKICIDYCTIM